MSLHRYFKLQGRRLEPSSLSDGVQEILAQDPKSVREVIDTGGSSSLPLHAAFEEVEQIDLTVVKQLVEAYPSSVRAKNSDQKLPIHFACESLQSAEIVGYLLDQYPESIGMTDAEGFTPLHYVCYEIATSGTASEHELDLVDLLLDRCPKSHRFDDFLLRIVPCARPTQLEKIALQTKNVPDSLRGGRLLLHALCHIQSAGIALLCYLQNILKRAECDKLLDARDENGNSILHTLARTDGFTALRIGNSRTFFEGRDEKTNVSVFKVLCKLRPALVFSRNHAGDTPLHVACRARLPLPCLDVLLAQDTTTADCRNNKGQLPIHLLVAGGTSSPAGKRPTYEHTSDIGKSNGCYLIDAIKSLTNASSQPLLGVADPTTGFVPFASIAAGASPSNIAQAADIVSAVLRADPSPLIVASAPSRKRKR